MTAAAGEKIESLEVRWPPWPKSRPSRQPPNRPGIGFANFYSERKANGWPNTKTGKRIVRSNTSKKTLTMPNGRCPCFTVPFDRGFCSMNLPEKPTSAPWSSWVKRTSSENKKTGPKPRLRSNYSFAAERLPLGAPTIARSPFSIVNFTSVPSAISPLINPRARRVSRWPCRKRFNGRAPKTGS